MVLSDFSLIQPGIRFDTQRLRFESRQSGIEGDAPGAVATHRPDGSIRVVVPHSNVTVGPRRFFQCQKAVSADPQTPLAESDGDPGEAVFTEPKEPIVDNNEIVTGSVHFGKFDNQRPLHCVSCSGRSRSPRWAVFDAVFGGDAMKLSHVHRPTNH
jgi:hypothetical protein